MEFTDESAPKIFGGDIKVHLLMFIKRSASDFDETLKQFSEVAKEFKGKMLFVYIDVDVEENGRVSEFFGLTKDDVPAVRIINMTEQDMAKFKPDFEKLTAESLRQFAQDFVDNKLKVSYRILVMHYTAFNTGMWPESGSTMFKLRYTVILQE